MLIAIINPNTTKNPLQHCSEGMSRLPWDPHLRTTKKPAALASTSASTSVSKSTAAQLLLRRGGTAAVKDESIEFFSTLRKCQPDHHVSGQTERGTPDGRGKGRRGCDDDELLSTEIGKHDYDWLLTPPASPLWSPATSAAGRHVSAAVPNRLARARSASYAKSNSRLALTRREDENPTSRLVRSSSGTHSSVKTPAIASSGRSSHVRTLSSASSSSSSINTASNASASSTPLGSASTSSRTPATARSAAANARSRRRDNAQARQVSGFATGKPKASPSSNPGLSAPTSTRPRATTGGSSLRSTSTATSQQPALARRGSKSNAVARWRFAIQSTTGSAAQAASPEPQPRDVSTHGARSSIIKPRPLPVAAKQCHGNGLAALSTTTQRWRPSPSPAVTIAQSAPSRDLLAIRSSRNGDCQKINVEKATPRLTAGLASATMTNSVTRTSSRQLANTNAKLTVNKNDGAPALRKPTVHQRSIRSVVSRSRLGLMDTTSDAGTTTRGWSTSEKGKLAAAAAARVAEPDAFPSTRYEAMLLREDPKNLTWLNGCDDDDGSGGAGLVEGSLEPLDVPAPAGTSGTAVRF